MSEKEKVTSSEEITEKIEETVTEEKVKKEKTKKDKKFNSKKN